MGVPSSAIPSTAELLAAATASAVAVLKPLLEGAAEDVERFAADMMKATAVAASTGRAGVVDEVLHQAAVYAEIHRLRIKREAQEQIKSVLALVLQIALAAVGFNTSALASSVKVKP